MNEITFRQFSGLCKKIGLDEDGFISLFGTKIEEPRKLWDRINQARYHEVVIPYRSLLDWYGRESGLKGRGRADQEKGVLRVSRAKRARLGIGSRSSDTHLSKHTREGLCRWGCGQKTVNISRICDNCWKNREKLRSERLPAS